MDLSIYETLKDILVQNDPEQVKKSKLNRLFQTLLDEALQNEQIHFTSLFSKLAYLGVRYQVEGSLMYKLHFLRKRLEQPSENQLTEDCRMISFLIPHLFFTISGREIPAALLELLPADDGIKHKLVEIESYIPHTRMVCMKIDREKFRLYGFLNEGMDKEVEVAFNLSERNERFTESLLSIEESRFPLLIELVEVEKNLEGILRPAAFIIEPDFLVDVTGIASCFNHSGTRTVGYILRKFLPVDWSKALLLGNISNYFLDRLVGDPTLKFEEVLPDIFSIDPLSFARIQDSDMSTLLTDMGKHFGHIQQAIEVDFRKESIELSESYLEPSFISPIYGLQGRLDLLHFDRNFSSIVELKSGGIYKPNVYGLKNDHYVQTLLYDLLVRSTFQGKKPRNYILYSKESTRTLRIAPRIAAQQKEALKIRNDLLTIEENLSNEGKVEALLNQINSQYYSEVKGFEATNINQFENRYSRLDQLEKKYFNAFVNFIAREHRFAKIGEYGQDKTNGLAGIWLDSHEEKKEQFNMISDLKIKSNQSSESNAVISLNFSEKTNRLSNFRSGDIVILYPLGYGYRSALKNQVFKCTIIDLQAEELTVRLKSQQRNQEIFKKNEYWAIEHDMLDHSFSGMYRQMYEWAGAPKEKRDLLLSRTSPAESIDRLKLEYSDLTAEQNTILANMVNSEDYFLVWGPPGTGKTSKIISHYIKYMMDNTDENLYVLAYTNRAVDELCEAIVSLGKEYEDSYLRIGSRYGSDPKYADKLLQNKISKITKRKALKKAISNHRIVVGTLASILNKEIIYELIPAEKIIIDEASQILEPNLVGLLSRFRHFILVGDHRQLPAVVVQDKKYSIVKDDSLQRIGLLDRRDSLFERLYKNCLSQKWDHAVGLLHFQGRMHREIMQFPNEQFYDHQLQILPQISRLSEELPKNGQINILEDSRMIFQQVDVPPDQKFSKTNLAEVSAVVNAVQLYEKMGYKLKEIGIITPFRAQIAAIKEGLLIESPRFQEISVDTVERYQGSARQVIIISFCCNSYIQFRSMISISTEGIDRKLNVALTRAKERILFIGDQNILRTNPLYDHLIAHCNKKNRSQAMK